MSKKERQRKKLQDKMRKEQQEHDSLVMGQVLQEVMSQYKSV